MVYRIYLTLFYRRMKLPCMPTKDHFQCLWWKCSLQNGTVIVGWIGIVASVILLIECLFTLLDIVHFFPDHNPPIIVAVIGFVSLIVNAFLIYGARCENPLLMLPYLLFSLIIFTMLAALVVYVLLTAYITIQPVLSITMTVFCILGIVVIFHAWAGIYSYYLELEIKLRPPPEYQLENLAFEKEMEQPEQYTPIPGEVITKDSSLNEHVPVSV